MTPSAAAAPPPRRAQQRRLSFAAGALLGALMLWRWYLPNMAPGILHGDMSELQYLAWKLGVSHGTGFPLYIWLGHLASYLPWGEPAWRVTLLSGMATAGALTFFYMTFIEMGPAGGPQRWLAAALGTGALGYAYMIWRHAIVSEVYTLHLFLMAAVIWLAVRWGNEQDDRLLYLGAFAWALSWGNHMMATALGPPLVVYCLCHRPAQFLDWRRTGTAIACFLGGAAAFVFLFWLIWLRDVPTEHLQVNIDTALDLYDVDPAAWPAFWRQAWFILSGEQFRGLMLAAPAEWKSLQWSLLPWRLLGQFLPVGVALGLVGWCALWRQRWRSNVLLNGILFTQLVLNMNYYMPWEIYAYYLPIYLVAAFWIAAGALLLLESIARPLARTSGARWAVPIGCLLLASLLAWSNLESGRLLAGWAERRPGDDWRRSALTSAGPRPDFSEVNFEEEARRILTHYRGDEGVFIGSFYHQYALYYLAESDFGMKHFMAYELSPTGHREGISPSRVEIIEANLGKRQILLAQLTPEIARRFSLREVATEPRLWEVQGRRR